MSFEDLVAEQAGMFARWQALALKVRGDTIDYRCRTGTWHGVHPGVYATFTGEVTDEARLWAALLLCSKELVHPTNHVGDLPEPDAVLSHETAAQLHGLTPKGAERKLDAEDLIHVTVPARRKVPRAAPGIKVHMSIRLDAARHPAASPPRTRVVDTVIDLTQTAAKPDAAISWLARACTGRLATADQLTQAVQARKKLRWRAPLQEALEGVREGAHSVLELRYRRNVELDHGLPRGLRQRRVFVPGVAGSADGGAKRGRNQYNDVYYEEFRIVIELDGHLGHEFDGRFKDHRRDNAAIARGDVPLRYGWTDVESRPCQVAVEVAHTLIAQGWTGKPTPCARPGCAVALAFP